MFICLRASPGDYDAFSNASTPFRLFLFSIIYLTRALLLIVVHIAPDLLQAIILFFFFFFSVPVVSVVGLPRMPVPNMP